jgi:hypothetical protein
MYGTERDLVLRHWMYSRHFAEVYRERWYGLARTSRSLESIPWIPDALIALLRR